MHLNISHNVNVLPHIYVIIQWHNAGSMKTWQNIILLPAEIKVSLSTTLMWQCSRSKPDIPLGSLLLLNLLHLGFSPSLRPPLLLLPPLRPIHPRCLWDDPLDEHKHTQSVWLIHSLHFSNSSYVQQTINQRREFCFWLHATINSWTW